MSEIGKTFGSIIRVVKKEAAETKHKNAIDIELNFEKVKLNNRGIPLIAKRSDREDLRIKLATTITDFDDNGQS